MLAGLNDIAVGRVVRAVRLRKSQIARTAGVGCRRRGDGNAADGGDGRPARGPIRWTLVGAPCYHPPVIEQKVEVSEAVRVGGSSAARAGDETGGDRGVRRQGR